jgi:hypothetical protein
MNRRAVGVVALVGIMWGIVGCRQPAKRAAISDYVEQYLGLCVALGERDPDSLDFYVGPEALGASARNDPPKQAEIALEAGKLRDRLGMDLSAGSHVFATDAEVGRARFLRGQLDALRLRAQMLGGKTLSMDEEGRILMGATAGVDTEVAQRVMIRKEIAELLGGEDRLAHRYSEFERGFLVTDVKVPAVMDAALLQCRAKTLQHIELPQDESIEVRYVSRKPWSAFSRYMGHDHSVISVNMDYPMTVDRIFNLACHEGYPGHHVFNMLREHSMVEGAHEEEWSAQPTFSPQSFVSEAAASEAPEVAFSELERLEVERNVLFPIAGLDGKKAAKYLKVEHLVGQLESAEPGIAREYIDGRLEFVRAEDEFEREVLMEDAQALMLYLNEYRSYMLSYTVGRRLMEERLYAGGATEEERWRRYAALMREPVYSLADRELADR